MKIPIIQADYPIPSSLLITARTEGAGQVWKAIGDVADEAQNLINTIVKQQGEVREKQRILTMNSDIAGGEADFLKSDKEFTIESRKNADPKTYLPNWEEAWDKRTKEKLDTITDPETQKRMEIVLKKNRIQRHDQESDYAHNLFVDTEKAKDIPILSDLAAREKLEEGLKYIKGRKDIYKPTDFENLKIKFGEEAEKEQLKNTIAKADMEIYQTPHKASEILQKDEYKNIPEDKKVSLLNKGITGANRIEEKIEEDTKNFSEQMYGDLRARIRVGENIIDLIDTYGPAGERMLIKSHFDSLLSDIDSAKKADKEGDPDVERDVAIRANAAIPQISEKEISDLMRSKKLGQIAGEKALDQIRTTNKSLRDEGRQKENQTYSDAEKYIREGMGVSGLVLQLQEKIDPTQQGLIARANAELWERSAGRGGKEDAMIVAREILPKYQKALSGQNLLSIESYKKLIDIGKYPNEDILHQHFVKGWINDNDYYRKAKAFKEMGEKIRLNEAIEALSEAEFGRKKK